MNGYLLRNGLQLGWTDFRGLWNWQTWLFHWFVTIVAQVYFFSLLGRLVGSDDYFEYLLIGNAAVSGCVVVVWTIPISQWNRSEGTYGLLVLAPASLLATTGTRVLIWALSGAATSILALIISKLLLGLDVRPVDLLLSLPLLVLLCASCFSWCLFLGGLVGAWPGFYNIVLRLATLLLMTFSGVNLPPDVWPEPVRLLSSILPVTHGLAALRQVLEGDSSVATILEGAGLEFAVAAFWMLAAIVTYDRISELGRRNGTIDLY